MIPSRLHGLPMPNRSHETIEAPRVQWICSRERHVQQVHQDGIAAALCKLLMGAASDVFPNDIRLSFTKP